VMQAVLLFNRPAIQERLEHAAHYLGIDGGFDGFHHFVGGLNDRLNIPASLAALGVTSPDKEAILKGALKDPSCGGNPVELTESNLRALIDSLF
jgi:alcohol dehydrogenase class IV